MKSKLKSVTGVIGAFSVFSAVIMPSLIVKCNVRY